MKAEVVVDMKVVVAVLKEYNMYWVEWYQKI